MRASHSSAGIISSANSTSALLAAAAVYTGAWEDVGAYSSVVVAVKTDQDGTFSVQFSPDGTNQDSTLTRYYRTDQIEAPHRFTVTRRYCRVVFTNTAASDQTYLRLQTSYGEKGDLNAPLDSTLTQDFDATAVRPTDYRIEAALDRRQGARVWNKFGYNLDIDSAATEVIASFGGTYVPPSTARTLSVVSTSAADASGGSGAESVIIEGIDANRRYQAVIVTMAGLTPAVTSETWLGVNRISVYLAGSGQTNAGTITATATTDLTIQGQIPAGSGVTQQCIYHVQEGHRAVAEWLYADVLREGGGTEPVVTVIAWVFSPVSNCFYEVARLVVDAAVQTYGELKPPLPFPIDGSTCFYLTGESTRNDTNVHARFSLTEIRNTDG